MTQTMTKLVTLLLLAAVISAFDLSQLAANTNCIGPTLIANTSILVPGNKRVVLSTLQCASFAPSAQLLSPITANANANAVPIIPQSIWHAPPICGLCNACFPLPPPPPKPKPTTTAKTTKTSTSHSTSHSTSTTHTSTHTSTHTTTHTTTKSTSSAPTPTPTGPVHVCGAPCTTSCNSDAGVLPPTDEDCDTIDIAIQIFAAQQPASFVVAPQHVETLSFGSCAYFFVNFNPVPTLSSLNNDHSSLNNINIPSAANIPTSPDNIPSAANTPSSANTGGSADVEACWSDFTRTSPTIRRACFPPAQPFTSEGLCLSSSSTESGGGDGSVGGSWGIGAAHS